MKQACRRSGAAHSHDHVAELRQGGIGEDTLDVVLLNCHQRRKQRGDSPHPTDDDQRVGREQKEQFAQHVHTGGHHSGRVDEGTHRCGPFHGVGQPNVQRELGALADCATKN